MRSVIWSRAPNIPSRSDVSSDPRVNQIHLPERGVFHLGSESHAIHAGVGLRHRHRRRPGRDERSRGGVAGGEGQQDRHPDRRGPTRRPPMFTPRALASPDPPMTLRPDVHWADRSASVRMAPRGELVLVRRGHSAGDLAASGPFRARAARMLAVTARPARPGSSISASDTRDCSPSASSSRRRRRSSKRPMIPMMSRTPIPIATRATKTCSLSVHGVLLSAAR